MEVTITNNGGYITIEDDRDVSLPSSIDVLKDGLDLLQFGDVVRIIYKDGTWFESLATQTEIVGFSGSITPSDGLAYYAAMWDVLADYGTGGGGGGSGTVTNVSALNIGTSGTDVSSSVANSTTTPVITLNIPTASATNRGALSSTDWSTFNGKQNAITLTTTGSSGAATLIGSTLNIPQYATSSGTVTSVSASVPSPASPALSVAVTNPTTTPAIAITANGSTSQYVRGDGSLAAFPTVPGTYGNLYQEDVYIAGTLITSVEYVSSVNKVYVSNGTSNTVNIFDASNGDLLASVAVTAPTKIKYIASINEVWVASSSATTLTRISPSGNTSLGTITGITAGGTDMVEYSSTKVFLVISLATGTIQVINPSTLAVVGTPITSGVPAFAYGMCWNQNGSSSQNGKMVVTGTAGIAIFDPTTNSISTSNANPSSAISNGSHIVYSPTQDKYYVASRGNNRLVVLSIASSTSFTATWVQNQLFLTDLCIDESNDYLFAVPMEGYVNSSILVKQYTLSTMAIKIAYKTSSTGGTGSISGYVARDSSNKRLFVVGRLSTANSSVCSIKYI